jgi:hypothetical protein
MTDDEHKALIARALEGDRLTALINNAQTADFLESVRAEAAHQVEKWGEAHDRDKSAENWFWLVGYLAGKCLRAAITGDKEGALHHTISAAAALCNWHKAIAADTSGCGAGADLDIAPVERVPVEPDDAPMLLKNGTDLDIARAWSFPQRTNEGVQP